MFKKKCGNCRFYENNNMAGSGWCRHPDRAQLNNLVMVRKTELACRNTWDLDLWEPQQAGRRINVEHPAARVPQPTSFKPPEGATDRVTDISVPLVKRPVAPLPSQGARLFGPSSDLDGDDDVDALAVLPWLKARGEAPADPLHASQSAVDDLPHTPDPVQPEAPPETPVILRPLVDFSVRAQQPNQKLLEKSRELPALEQEVRAYVATADAPPASTEPAPRAAQYTEPLPVLPAGSVPVRETKPFTSATAMLHAEASAQILHLSPRPFVLDGIDDRPQTRPAVEPIDRISVLSGLQRCCGTCRDFRRNPDGRTGICANRYAYLEEPVVKSDELACRSSAGIWWLPNDDLFVNAADTAHHARPTPNLDAVLGPRPGSETGRDSRAW